MAESVPLTLIQFSNLCPQSTFSPPCGKVQMALAFKGLEYEVENVGSGKQIRHYNPRGRLPVLCFGTEIVCDSSDILDELDRRFPDPPLAPSEPGALARVKIWEDWGDEVLYFYGVYLRWQIPENFAAFERQKLKQMPRPFRWFVPKVLRRMVLQRLSGQGVGLKSVEVVLRELHEAFALIDQQLSESSFLTGEQVTRADFSVASLIDQIRVPQLLPLSHHEPDSYPRILDWLERVHAVSINAAVPREQPETVSPET